MELGSTSLQTFSCLARQEGISKNTLKSKVLGDIFGRLSFILIEVNARAFLPNQSLPSKLKLTQHAMGSSHNISDLVQLYLYMLLFIIKYDRYRKQDLQIQLIGTIIMESIKYQFIVIVV